jgi:hypothetical protein
MSVFGSIVSAIFGSKHGANAALTAGGPAFISRHYGICGGGTNNGRFSRFVDHHPHLKSRR